ncbi:MAG TPA: hypothetical protein VGP72_08980 [Planctomycetota bacterium]
MARRDGQPRMTGVTDASGVACSAGVSVRREGAGEAASSPFVPIQIRPAVDTTVCEIVLRNGLCLRLGRTADVKWIAALAAALEDARSC